uniref:Proton-activated chloride channel n=2 Tax=Tetraodon nigroviridis TaxID=99883 RepID=H3CYV8_TETNG
MRRKDSFQSYQEIISVKMVIILQMINFIDEDDEDDKEDGDEGILNFYDKKEGVQSRRFSKLCVKNFFTVLLILIYLLLTAVAAFLAYQTISEVLEKLKNPVMSVTYQEVDSFPRPGIALYPGNAQLLGCSHYYHNDIPPLVDPGKPQEIDCVVTEVAYVGPFSSKAEKRALVIQGPSEVRSKEVVFMQFSSNETGEDFSAIRYMIFADFSDLMASQNKSRFMRECERNCSRWTFSGGFRTWVKMSLVKTFGKHNVSVEFRQETAVVKFNDRRPASEQTNQLYFAVFQWRDPYIQQNKMIVTANPWSSIAILSGVFMALFKAANFAKLTIQWIIRMRKRHLRNKERELNPVT